MVLYGQNLSTIRYHSDITVALPPSYFCKMRLLLCLLWSTLSFTLYAQFATWQFGLGLSPNSNGQLYGLFLVKVHEGKVIEARPLARQNFVHQAQGRAKSEANPTGEDLFFKYGVKDCLLPPDSTAMGFHLSDCITLDDVWKLRYWEYPQKAGEGDRIGKGWSAQPLKPSDGQMAILARYGLHALSDLIIGEQLFKLLHDMNDAAWVSAYRQG